MRVLLWLWFAPLAFFWTWYALAASDFGYVFFSRQMHDLVFSIYADTLGVDAAIIPAWIARVCLIDSAVVLGVFALARRKRIMAWWRARGPERNAQSATSLSSTP